MKSTLLLLAVTLTTMTGTIVAAAQTPAPDSQAPFRFEIAPSVGRRGLGVEGYVYNGSDYRITNIRVQIEGLDDNGAVTTSTSGWVMGTINAGSRGYFSLPMSSAAKTYRATVQSYDKVALQSPRPAPAASQAP